MALNNIRRLIPASMGDHVFQLPGENCGSFTYRHFQAMLQKQLDKIGISNSSCCSSHSFRRGGTTFCFLSGVPTEMIKLLGNWKSDAYLSYLEFPLETCTAACQLIKFRLLALENRSSL